MLTIRLIPLLLIAISSNLQSCFVAQAANIACGSIATFGPAPLVAGQSSPRTFSVTTQDSSKTYLLHGNADDTCLDAFSIILSSSSSYVINSDVELTYFKGSENYKVCFGGNSTACSLPRLIPFFNPRNGAWKDSMLGTTPMPVWTAPAAAPATSFSITINAGSHSFTSLAGNGYTFSLGLGTDRRCVVLATSVSWGSQIAVSSSALTFNVSGLSAGAYSLCMKVQANGTTISNYFPISGILGHSVHNLNVGLPQTDVKWTLTPVYLSRLSYATVVSSDVTLIVENTIVTDGWKFFGIDTSADVCSALLSSAFSVSDLQTYNATHVFITTTIPRPVGAPGGGQAVLCGALSSSAPWTLLSTSPYWPWVYDCSVGYGVTLPTSSGCSSCQPQTNPCNGNGNCGTFEAKTHVRSATECTCYSRWYSDASYCDRYDLDPPTLTPGNGTYKTKHLVVTITKPAAADQAVLTNLASGTQYQCVSASCTFVVEESGTFTAVSSSSNGSTTLSPSAYSYVIIHPTDSSTRTKSISDSTPSNSITESNTDESDSMTDTSTTSLTIQQKHLTRKTSTIIAVPPATTFAPTRHATPPPSGNPTLKPTATKTMPKQTSTLTNLSVILLAESNYTVSVLNQTDFQHCITAACTAGITLSCSDMMISATYVSPSNHSCDAKFASSGFEEYHWDVLIDPITVTRANLYYSTSPTVITVLRYRASAIPYAASTEEVALRGCEDDLYTNTTLHLVRGNRCVIARVFAAGFQPLETRIQLESSQTPTVQSNLNVESGAQTSVEGVALSKDVNVTPGGIILGVATGVVISLIFLTQLTH